MRRVSVAQPAHHAAGQHAMNEPVPQHEMVTEHQAEMGCVGSQSRLSPLSLAFSCSHIGSYDHEYE
jgi:hypothetical protein